MSLQAYTLRKPWELDEDDGVVIVETCSGMTLPIAVHALHDVEDAHAFLEWAGVAVMGIGYHASELGGLVSEWNGLRPAHACPICKTRNSLALRRVRHGEGWIVSCLCDDAHADMAGNGLTPGGACEDWNAAVAAHDEGSVCSVERDARAEE